MGTFKTSIYQHKRKISRKNNSDVGSIEKMDEKMDEKMV